MSRNRNNKILRAAVIAGFTAISVHVINTIISSNALLKNKLSSAQELYYEWRFGRIFYTKKGSGDPILLVHDILPGMAGYEWKKLEDQLSKSNTVHTIDLLGCGRSDKPDITYTNYLYVQLLTDFVKNVIEEPVDVIASGFSSTFAAMSCLNDEDAFRRVVMINPPEIEKTQEMPEEKDRIFRKILQFPIFGTLIYNMIVSKDNVTNLFVEKQFYNPFDVTTDLVDTYYESSHKGGSYAKNLYACTISKYLNVNISNALRSIDHPILIVTGENQKDKDIAYSYLAYNDSYQICSLEKSKKMPHYEKSVEFYTAVKEFLQ